MGDFEGLHVAVTGATGALGTGVVNRLLAAGATCHGTYLFENEVHQYPYARRISLQRVDCTDGRAVVDWYRNLPHLHAAVHLVGGFTCAPFVDTSVDEYRRLMELNAGSAFVCCREAIRRMVSEGVVGVKRIVNVAARPAVEAGPGMVAYSMAKAAVAQLTRSLAEEIKSSRILVNAVVPSIMDTPPNRQAMPTADHDLWPKVEQVADVITHLVGPRNLVTSGALVPVYGRA